ncbi:MAG: hypothetical protein ACRC42_02305 [Mycoplasma sp.]
MRTWAKVTLGIISGLVVSGGIATNIYFVLTKDANKISTIEDISQPSLESGAPNYVSLNGIIKHFSGLGSDYDKWLGNGFFDLTSFPGQKSLFGDKVPENNTVFNFISADFAETRSITKNIVITFSADRKFDANGKMVVAGTENPFEITAKDFITYTRFDTFIEGKDTAPTNIDFGDIRTFLTGSEDGLIIQRERLEEFITLNNFPNEKQIQEQYPGEVLELTYNGPFIIPQDIWTYKVRFTTNYYFDTNGALIFAGGESESEFEFLVEYNDEEELDIELI